MRVGDTPPESLLRIFYFMARPFKHNADYFPHDADMRNDPRIKAVRRKFGIEGYGIYAMLLEFITDSDYFEFKNDSLSLELIAGDFDIETSRLVAILQYCFQLDLFQLDAETNIISCKSLDNRLEPLLSKRKRDRSVVIDSDNTQSKVKESKVKESKEEKRKVKESTETNACDFDDLFLRAFDENTCESYKLAFRGFDLGAELQKFRIKCDNDKPKYYGRDVGGLRTAFQYQLQNLRKNGTSKDKRTEHLTGLAKDFAERHGTGIKP
jgi:hypothetical protein